MAAEYIAHNNDFSWYDDNLHLVRIDKNNTHYYIDHTCPKCGGKGYLPGYEHIEGGICFLCGGTGKGETKVVVRTEEYSAKLEQRRLEKRRKGAAEANAKFLTSLGFSADGKTYIVLGDTYGVKDQLKEAGAKFNKLFGWHFDNLDNASNYPIHEVSKDTIIYEDDKDTITLLEEDQCGHLHLPYADYLIIDFIKNLQENYRKTLAPETFFYGNIKDKIQINVTLVMRRYFDTQWGTTWVYKFTDNEGHVFIWKTSNYVDDLNEGDQIQLKGTIKEHNAYRGVNQTTVTRCKIIK